MRIYFLGIGGTLMGSLAQLARELGHEIHGSDRALYPPMSDQLAAADIQVYEGFEPGHLQPAPDLVVIGNAGLPRGNEAVEAVLNSGLPYTSGAQWLGDAVLPGRWTLAVAGTHGKTTTASMLAWILECAGLEPGYLIGGVPQNFNRSARLGGSPFFVVEADEYDTSYFDRRSKFVHYRPRTLVINNLEFDHADIFPNLQAIQTQFHQLLRSVPGDGLIVMPSDDPALEEVVRMGCWTPVTRFGSRPPQTLLEQGDGERQCLGNAPPKQGNGDIWSQCNAAPDGSAFDVALNGEFIGRIDWPLLGAHNIDNALGAVAAARHAGVPAPAAIAALNRFSGVKRRLEIVAEVGDAIIYDDFAHHPTAIRTTLEGLRQHVGGEEILAVVEPRTHTMSLGTLRADLTTCCAAADRVFWFRGERIRWDIGAVVADCPVPARLFDNLDTLMRAVAKLPQQRRHIVILSNGGFQGIHRKLPAILRGEAKH